MLNFRYDYEFIFIIVQISFLRLNWWISSRINSFLARNLSKNR